MLEEGKAGKRGKKQGVLVRRSGKQKRTNAEDSIANAGKAKMEQKTKVGHIEENFEGKRGGERRGRVKGGGGKERKKRPRPVVGGLN